MVSDSDDEDWFERAIGDEADSEEADEAAPSEGAAGERETDTEEAAREGEAGGEGAIVGEGTTSGEGAGDGERAAGGEGDVFGGEADGETDDFDTDFGTAFQNAPEPDVADGAFDGSVGPDGPGGAPEIGSSGDAEFGGPDTDSFDESEFESNIERLDIGIDGLDEMILGGVPERSLMVAIGSAGTGKTTFGMEFLRTALEDGDNAIYISLEESRERILDTADEKGWDFSGYEEAGQLAIATFDPVEMANTLSSIQSELPRLIEEFDADRLVLDSVSLLEMMYDRASERRSQVFDFAKSLKEAGITTFVTSEASGDNPYASRYGIIEYLADAVFVLRYVRPSDFQETRLAIEIQKVRDANHSRETKPYEITNEGISVYRQANIF